MNPVCCDSAGSGGTYDTSVAAEIASAVDIPATDAMNASMRPVGAIELGQQKQLVLVLLMVVVHVKRRLRAQHGVVKLVYMRRHNEQSGAWP